VSDIFLFKIKLDFFKNSLGFPSFLIKQSYYFYDPPRTRAGYLTSHLCLTFARTSRAIQHSFN